MAVGEVRIRHIDREQLDELIDAQNEIFSDYLVPMKSSKEFFLDFLRSVGGDLSNVMVAMDDDRIVGYVNPVVDGDEAWVGGVGVLPQHRGGGLGKRLMRSAEDFARGRGAQRISLEVIEGNARALRLYENLGYEERRRFVCADGKPMQFAGYGIQPTPASTSDLVDMHANTYADACWQRRKTRGLVNSVRNAEGYVVDGGFVLVRRVGTTGYIPYLGVLPEMRGKGIGTSLAKFALNKLWELGVYKIGLYNLNEDGPIMRMLDKFGFAVTMKQIEMWKHLDKKT